MSIYVSFTGSNQSTKGTLSITLQQLAETQSWIIKAMTATSFSVVGSRSGDIGVLTVDVPFLHDDGVFTISVGVQPFEVGDTFKFSVHGLTAPRYVKKNSQGDIVNYLGGPSADLSGDGTWLVSRRMFENLPRVIDSEIAFGDTLDHFRNIIRTQDGFEGSSFGVNNYRNLNVDTGLGGTIRDYSGNFALLAGNLMQSHMSPLTIIDFAEIEYAKALSSIDQFIVNDLAQFIASTNPLNRDTLPTISSFDETNENVVSLLNHFESLRASNQHLKDVYTDTTSPIANWPITLPFMGLTPAVEPTVKFDLELNFSVIVHHDGHVSPVATTNSELEKLLATTIVERSDGVKTGGTVSMNASSVPYARQLWFDSSTFTLKTFSVNYDTEETPVGAIGQFWFKRSTQMLYEWDATVAQWTISSDPVYSRWLIVDSALIRNLLVLAVETKLFDAVHPATMQKFALNLYANAQEAEIELAKFAARYSYDMFAPDYVAGDAFTWNYSQAVISGVTSGTARWFDIYLDYFDQPGSLSTDRPDLEPWKLIGYASKSAANSALNIDWDAMYADTTNTRKWTTSMWTMITAARPSLKLCVNTLTDVLLPPYVSSSNAASINALLTAIPAGISEGYSFGQNGPVEMVWKKSLEFKYGMARVAFKTQPMEFLDKTWGYTYVSAPGSIRIERNISNSLSPSKFKLHGERLSLVTSARPTAFISGNKTIATTDTVRFVCSHVEDNATYFYAFVNDELIGSITEGLPFSFTVGSTSFVNVTLDDLGIPFNLGDSFVITASNQTFTPAVAQKFLGLGQIFTNLLRHNFISTDASDSINAYRGWVPRLAHRIGGLIRSDSLRIGAASVETLPTTAYDVVLKRSSTSDSKWISAIRVQLVEQGTKVLNSFGNEIPYGDGADWKFRVEVYNPQHPIAEYYTFDTNAAYQTFGILDSTATNLKFKHFTERTNLVSSPMPQVITGIQSVVNFLFGYTDYLTDQGWTLNAGDRIITDEQTGRNLDWQLEVEKFVDAVYRGVNVGDGHILNPFMHGLWLNTPTGLMSRYSDKTFLDADSTQAVYDVTGAAIPVTDIQVIRTDDHTVTYSDTPIFSAHAFIDEFEHVILFNYNVSDESNSKVVYNPFLGLRIQTADLSYVRQEELDRKPRFNGFVLAGNEVKRNITSSIDAVANYYDAHKTFNEPHTAPHALALLGWSKKDYFQALGTNDTTQFNFWRGLIQSKGTNLTIDAFANYKKFNEAGIDEYWAYKLAEFGDARKRNYPEIKIEVTDALQNFTQLQFYSATDDGYVALPLFTQIENNDDARWYSLDDLGTGLTFASDDVEQTIPSLNVGYYPLTTILHNGDSQPKVYLKTTTVDGEVSLTEATTAEMVNASLMKVYAEYPVASIVDSQVFFYEENQAPSVLVAALSSSNAVGYRFTTTNNQLSPDGNFFINDDGNISLTAIGARSPITSYDDLVGLTAASRLVPKYWRVSGSSSMSFALTTSGNNLRVDFASRSRNDTCVLQWTSVDTDIHSALSYQTKKDYRAMTWDFDIEVDSTSPVFNDSFNWLRLIAEGRDSFGNPISYQIPIYQYADSPSGRSAHVTINFSTVKAGFLADTDTFMGDIDRLYITTFASSYDGTSTPLSVPVSGFLKLSNCTVSGSNSLMSVGHPDFTPHDLKIQTNYDEVFNQSPERVIENIVKLGFVGVINHDVGCLYFPEKTWNGIDRYEVVDSTNTDGLNVVNVPAQKWHANFMLHAHTNGFAVQSSVSIDMPSSIARLTWMQTDWAGNFATSGSPSIYKITPTNVDAKLWLTSAMTTFAQIAQTGGMTPVVTVGRMGWWVNADDYPCVYDATTKAKFTAETGLVAPNIGTSHSVQDQSSTFVQWRSFLKKEIGSAAKELHDSLHASIPTAQVGLLIDFSTNIDGGVIADLNLPSSYFASTNFEFIQLSAFNWMNSGQSVESAIDFAKTLGYTSGNIQLLAGQVSTGNSFTQWKKIFEVSQASEKFSIRQFLSTYGRVMSDNITFIQGGEIDGIQFDELRAMFFNDQYYQVYPNGGNDFELIPNAFKYSIQARGEDGTWSKSINFSIALSNIEEPGDSTSRVFATYIKDVGPTTYEYIVRGSTWHNQTKLAPVKLFNYKDSTLVTEIPLWHPAIGIHSYETLDVVNSITASDPALYNSTIKTVNNPNYAVVKPWGKREVGRVWWDTSNLAYIPYYDAAIFADRNERNARWGNLADWASVDLYEWIESDVAPDDYDALAAVEEGSSDIPPSSRKSGTAAFKKYYSRNRLISMRPVAWSYTPSGNTLAHPSFGSPTSQKAMIASSAIFIDAIRLSEAGLTEGRHFAAWKANKPYGEAVVGADVIYDIGNTTELSSPFIIASGFIDSMSVSAIADGRLGNFIGKIKIESRVDQIDSSTFIQKLRMQDAFGNFEEITIDDWFAASDVVKEFKFVDFGLQITVTRSTMSSTYNAADIAADIVSSWSDVYIREGVRFTEILSLPDTTFVNDATDPDISNYDFGWRAWDVPSQLDLDGDLVYPRNAWLPYLGDLVSVEPTPSVIEEMKNDGLSLKSGVSINRVVSTWSEWTELKEVRISRLSNGQNFISFDRDEFLTQDEELDVNRISIFANGLQLSPKLYVVNGEVGAESIQLLNVQIEGTTVLLIYRAKQLTDEELSFDSSVEDDPTIQTEYRKSYQYTKVDVRSEAGAIVGAKYYFWVQDSTVVRPNKSVSLVQAKASLKNGPSQYMTFAKLDDRTKSFDSCVIAGLNRYVTNNDTYKLRFIQDETLRDDPEDLKLKNIHTEWILLKKTQNSKIPLQLWEKLTDAAAGTDSGGNPLPSVNRVDYDARHGTRTSYGFEDGQIIAATDLVRATIKNTILNTSLEIRVGDIVYADKILALDFDTSEEWFKDAVTARATMNLIWSSARAKQINEIFFAVLEDALANNYELTDIFKTSMISVYSTSAVTQQNQSELQDGIF